MAHGRSCMAVLCTLAVVLGVPVAGQLSSPAPSSARAAQRSGVPPRAHKHYFPDAKYPAFNWNTLPLYWYSTDNDAPFSDKVARYAASFPVVVPNGNYMRYAQPSMKGEEVKLALAAKQIMAINSSASVLFYLNSMMDWQQYDLHGWIAKNHPEWWIINEDGRVVCLGGQPLFNLSIPAMRDHWIGTVMSALSSGLYAGVFADRANALPKGYSRQPGPGQSGNGFYNQNTGACEYDARPFEYNWRKYDAWAQGHATLLKDAQDHVNAQGGGEWILANNNATPGVYGRQFERWCRADFDKKTIVADIATLQASSSIGKVTLVHGGEPCDSAALNLSMAAFLIGAGDHAYYACTDGWSLGAGWLPENRPKEYDLPLGDPLGPATQVNAPGSVRYQRGFKSGTWVTLTVPINSTEEGTPCIYWAGGHVSGSQAACIGNIVEPE